MSQYQKMKEALENVQEIRGSVMSKLVSTKDAYKDMIKDIELDPDLSPAGKQKRIDQIKKEAGKGFLSIAKEMKDNYQQSVIKAKVNAEMLLNERPKKPAMGNNEHTFARQFNDLKMKLMLESRANYAMDHLNAFISQQKDPFFAQQIIDEYPQLVQTVLGSADPADSAKYKVELSKTLDNVKKVATTPEQQEAAEIYESMDGAFSRDLFGRGLAMDTVQDLFGRDIAKYVNNPEQYVDKDESEEIEEAE